MKSVKNNSTHIADRVVKLFGRSKTRRLTTREVYKGINRGRRPKLQASIYGVRRAVRILVNRKQLKVCEVDHRMWVLQKR